MMYLVGKYLVCAGASEKSNPGSTKISIKGFWTLFLADASGREFTMLESGETGPMDDTVGAIRAAESIGSAEAQRRQNDETLEPLP